MSIPKQTFDKTVTRAARRRNLKRAIRSVECFEEQHGGCSRWTLDSLQRLFPCCCTCHRGYWQRRRYERALAEQQGATAIDDRPGA